MILFEKSQHPIPFPLKKADSVSDYFYRLFHDEQNHFVKLLGVIVTNDEDPEKIRLAIVYERPDYHLNTFLGTSKSTKTCSGLSINQTPKHGVWWLSLVNTQ